MPEIILKPKWAMIQGKALDATDIGRKVAYQAFPNAPYEIGVLSSFRDNGAIYVRFNGPQGERCPPNTLSWRDDELDTIF